ncbi:MAG: hypothetical protein PHY92_10325 [Alphaproteobacteria bacterium]|nr:hypothetical protein [Alphaproteobacteria bacterium]
MKQYLRIFWFFALILDFPLPAQAEVEDGTHIDPAFIAPLMQWVENELGVQVPVMPRVIASRSHFDKVLARMGNRFAGRPQSVYIPGTVYMDSLSWDPEDSTQLSLLVHELVHHAQMFMRDKVWPCSQAKETLAYTLQNRWLEQNDHSPFVNVAWVERVSSCPERPATTLLAQR